MKHLLVLAAMAICLASCSSNSTESSENLDSLMQNIDSVVQATDSVVTTLKDSLAFADTSAVDEAQ